MAKVRLIQISPGLGLERAIDSFTKQYLDSPFNTFLVVPDAAIRDRIKNSLVEQNIPIFGASVCTLNELASHIFNANNNSDVPIDQYLVELILYKLLEENKERLSLFNGAWGTVQAMVPGIRAFLETLQDYQVDYPNSLGNIQSERSKQLGRIRDLYFDFLKSNHMVDRGLKLKWVTERIMDNREVKINHITFYGLFEPKPIEKIFIQAITSIAQQVDYYIPFVAGSKAFSDDGSWLNADKNEESGKNDDSDLTPLFSSGQKRHLDNIVKGTFRDPLDELRAIAREITGLISSGAEPSSIAVILPVRSKSAPLVKEVFEDYELPFDLHLETPLAESPLVISIFSILEAVHSDYDRDLVVRLTSSPFFTFKVNKDGKQALLLGHEIDEVSREAQVIRGKDAWSSALSSLATQIKDEMAEEGGTIGHLKFELEKISRVEIGLLQLLEALSILEGELTVPQRTDALRKLLLRFELTNNLEKDDDLVYEQEVRALNSFLSTLDAMEMGEFLAPSGQTDLGEFLAKLRMLASAEGFHESPENRNAVQVSGLRASYLMRYEYVFVVGLVDGDIPFLAAGNAFVREREAVRMGLLNKDDLLRQERFYFLSTLLSSTRRTYVSRPESDGSNILVPSIFLDNLEASFDLDTFGIGAKETSSLCCQRMVGEMIAKKRDLEEVGVELSVHLDDICHRIAVECDERVGDYHSPYDALFADATTISALNVILDKRGVYSPSRLEAYAGCPFRYYLNYVAGIEPVQEIETALTPASRGTLFHRIAFRFYSELREQGEIKFNETQLEEMTNRIKRIGQEELDRYKFDGPVWQAFQTTMLGSGARKGLLRAFLEREVVNGSKLSPKFFELSFGLPLDDREADPASRAEPVEIDLGGEKLKLRCRIDRVDATNDGKFVVLDYKTGASTPSVSSIEKGIALQLPLYIQAVEAALDGMTGIGGAYYGVRNEVDIDYKGVFGNKDHIDLLGSYFGERKRYKEEFAGIIEQSNRFILSYLEAMRAGRFHPNIGPAQCPNGCEYATVCRVDANRLGGEGDDD